MRLPPQRAFVRTNERVTPAEKAKKGAEMNNDFFKEASRLQDDYQELIDKKKLTKKAMCDLCVPFRDKYGLTDLQTLRIARREMDLSEMVALTERQGG